MINLFPEQLRAAAIDVTMWLLWSCHLRSSVFAVYMWYAVNKLVYMTVYVLEIELVSSFSVLYHWFSLHFCILFKIGRLYSFI